MFSTLFLILSLSLSTGSHVLYGTYLCNCQRWLICHSVLQQLNWVEVRVIRAASMDVCCHCLCLTVSLGQLELDTSNTSLGGSGCSHLSKSIQFLSFSSCFSCSSSSAHCHQFNPCPLCSPSSFIITRI